MRLAVLLPTVALLIPLVSTAAPDEQSARTLRVLTYNIHHGEGTDQKLDLERIARVIKAARPDLVALQEVDQYTRRTGGVDQAARLGQLTGLHAAFGKAMDYQGGAYGLAVLSRWPLVEHNTHPLPADPGSEPRAVLATRVSPGGSGPEITLLVTHFDHRSDPTQRMKQSARLRELFGAAGSKQLMILAGDLNARPESPVLKELLATTWTDSADGQQFGTIPAGIPRSRIDYILYRPGNRWRVIETRALEEAIASDHRPVLAVLELEP